MATPHNSISNMVLAPGTSEVAPVIGGNSDTVPPPLPPLPPAPPANRSASGTPTMLVPIITPGGGAGRQLKLFHRIWLVSSCGAPPPPICLTERWL